MTTLCASTEIGDEIKVVFTVTAHRADYGVDGSPSFWDWEASDVEIDSLEILGVEVSPMEIPTKLRETILEYAVDLDFED